jgi:hypothetical protein
VRINSYLLAVLFTTFSAVISAKTCLDNICIGDDVESLNVEWKPLQQTYLDRKFFEEELATRSVSDIYYDYNEQLIAERAVLTDLLVPVIRKQLFDGNVLGQLKKVRAICSSLTLTGEVVTGSDDKIFVTFRAIANNQQRGMLRVVGIEKQYNLMASHLRPRDRGKIREVKKQLKAQYPNIITVTDIDSRAAMGMTQKSNILVGYRFISDVSNPLILKIIDNEDIQMIEDSSDRHPGCQSS